ncbi:MAG TPA: translation initiation factor IF-3 [Candidatus Saccharimonadales bacterium]|nr:translation initiation factor IF-3 [Candidatus Saccharimonadales bacterium]
MNREKAAIKGANSISKSVRINGAIRASELRVVGPDGNQIGVLSRSEALSEAEKAGLDLVEVSPMASPPVARIVDWGKYLYQKTKEQQKSRKNSKAVEVKQMRMGLKIGANDLEIKLRKIREFLEAGHKVKIMVFFRGREMAHQELGYDLLRKIADQLSEVAVVDQKPIMAGKNLGIVVRSTNAKTQNPSRNS